MYNPNSMYVKEVESEEVVNIIKQLKNASSGYDGIHSSILKQTYMLYLQPLVYVFNLCITQGTFPNELKKAKVIPLHKNGDNEKLTNYRPVSILPLFSKILEKLMYTRLMASSLAFAKNIAQAWL